MGQLSFAASCCFSLGEEEKSHKVTSALEQVCVSGFGSPIHLVCFLRSHVMVPKAGERFLFPVQLPPALHGTLLAQSFFPAQTHPGPVKTTADPETVKMVRSLFKRQEDSSTRCLDSGSQAAALRGNLWGTTDITFPSQGVPSRHPGLSATPQLLRVLLLQVVLGRGS